MKSFSFTVRDVEVATHHMKALVAAHNGTMSPDQASVCIGVLLSAFNFDTETAFEVMGRANLARKSLKSSPSVLVAANE